jgi:hypothetical protein
MRLPSSLGIFRMPPAFMGNEVGHSPRVLAASTTPATPKDLSAFAVEPDSLKFYPH